MLMTFSPIKNVVRNMNAYAEKCQEYGYKCQPDQLGWALPLYVAETDEKAIEEARPHIQNFFNKFVLAPTEYRMPPGYSSINSYKMIMENKMKFREQFLSIEMLMEKHPRERFLANINPANERSIEFFRSLGFVHIQNTYEKR